jgi:hypothetical protein
MENKTFCNWLCGIDVSIIDEKLHPEETFKEIPKLISVDPSEVDQFIKESKQLATSFSTTNNEANPLILVRSTGQQHLDRIVANIESLDLKANKVSPVSDFSQCAFQLYGLSDLESVPGLWYVVAKKYLEKLGLQDLGYLIELDSDYLSNYDYLKYVKRSIRSNIGNQRFITFYSDKIIDIGIHHIHVPDRQELEEQFRIINNYVEE